MMRMVVLEDQNGIQDFLGAGKNQDYGSGEHN